MKKVLFVCVYLCFALACNTPPPSQTDAPLQKTEENLPEGKPKNVILLIGDGMGLSQITGSMYNQGNASVFERFKVIGLHKSHSSDNLVTDSAAGATAFASGVKTYNGAIGVDAEKNPVPTILEEAESRGLATGLVSSSSIVHATPACFIAHVDDRRKYEEIALFFTQTEVDLFIGGGKSFFDRRVDGRNLYDELKKKNYVIQDYFTKSLDEVIIDRSKNFGYLTADKEPLPAANGRDYLIEASHTAINYLNGKSREGFFLMIEGSQIDWGGHANEAEYVLTEMAEYEKIISLALDYAKDVGNTLVVVTADHETGGFAINPESTMDDLKIEWTTGGHTATMIPVFAHGPGAKHFAGVYENTEIYHHLRKALGWSSDLP